MVRDRECVRLLQWAAPRLGLRWRGFRNVRGQVCKRIARRIESLGLRDVDSYIARLEAEESEWGELDRLCGVTISRFYRDHTTWEALVRDVLPAIAKAAVLAGEDELNCWSIGCASGEEPYTLAIAWQLGLAARFPRLGFRLLATDFDPQVLSRAQVATYASATLRELPDEWRAQAFERAGELFRLRDEFRSLVEFRQADVRGELPSRRFRLILCRNVVFTYFDEARQEELLRRLLTALADGGAFVLGRHEAPPSNGGLSPWHSELGIFRHAAADYLAATASTNRA